MPVQVLIVDDQRPFRDVARTVVTVTPNFEVVGEACSGEEAVEMAAALRPDLVLMDVNLPGINGVEAVRRIRAQRPEIVAFLLSTYERDDLAMDASASGAAAYIHKEEFHPTVLTSLWDAGGDPSWAALPA